MQELIRILYAEDQIDIQQVATLALETVGGLTLKTCNTGLEAVNAIPSFEPQLLLFDVMMPDMDGPTALAKIREIDQYKNIPAIFMTAKVQSNEIQNYLDMGALAVIAKPFDPMTLASQIQEIWQRNLQSYDT
ncbi:response regulator [Colwellia sp. UCD-KL20]|uniref:response regulator n=1 Tax=Colwellia sp. UCD-KL20 TaxID=1917165 RepID=UPI0009709B63|nr:response regulator [Colwellia sp. UCD-KL20]